MKKTIGLIALVFLLARPSVAHAYIGPGIGAGTVAVVLGFIASICLAMLAVLWYPIKKLIRALRKKNSEPAESGE